MIEFHHVLTGIGRWISGVPAILRNLLISKPGDLLFFLLRKAVSAAGYHREKGNTVTGRFQKAHTLSFDRWNVHGTDWENGYASEEELYDAIVKVSKNKKMPKLMNCLVSHRCCLFQAWSILSEIGVEISNKVEKAIFIWQRRSAGDIQSAGTKPRKPVDMWISRWVKHWVRIWPEEEQIIASAVADHGKISDSFYTESEKEKTASFGEILWSWIKSAEEKNHRADQRQ